MGISRFLTETKDFEVLGEQEDDWEEFNLNVEYEGFLVRRKK
jgi:Na+-transporting NADH:ubiquinone oxidoreductase subunit NqrF